MRKMIPALLFVGCSTLLAEAQTPADRAKPAGVAPARAGSGTTKVEKMGDAVRTAPARGAGGAKGAAVAGPEEIGFIDNQNVLCYQPDPRQDVCFINWGYTSVSASPSYMVAMWVRVEGKVVARLGGFFQTSLYASAQNMGQGFRVACGPPVDDPMDPATTGKRQVGNAYNWDIKAVDSAGLGATNYGQIRCPPYIP